MNAKSILVPVTLGEGSLAAVAVAARLASELAAVTMLFHVRPTRTLSSREGDMRRLRELAARAKMTTPFECAVSEGEVAEEIVWRAGIAPVDAIVMATHARTGFSSWLHRQTARKVLGQARCPVLLVLPTRQGQGAMVAVRPGLELFKRDGVALPALAPIFYLCRPASRI